MIIRGNPAVLENKIAKLVVSLLCEPSMKGTHLALQCQHTYHYKIRILRNIQHLCMEMLNYNGAPYFYMIP